MAEEVAGPRILSVLGHIALGFTGSTRLALSIHTYCLGKILDCIVHSAIASLYHNSHSCSCLPTQMFLSSVSTCLKFYSPLDSRTSKTFFIGNYPIRLLQFNSPFLRYSSCLGIPEVRTSDHEWITTPNHDTRGQVMRCELAQ